MMSRDSPDKSLLFTAPYLFVFSRHRVSPFFRQEKNLPRKHEPTKGKTFTYLFRVFVSLRGYISFPLTPHFLSPRSLFTVHLSFFPLTPHSSPLTFPNVIPVPSEKLNFEAARELM